MTFRSMVIASSVGVLTSFGSFTAATADHKTTVTIWSTAAAPNPYGEYGGGGYGGMAATTGAYVVERRDVDVTANGEVRVPVPATIDAASVNIRDLTDPAGIAITEQRFVPPAKTPTEIIARAIGKDIAIVTTKGEITGVLRAVDDTSLVVETAGHLQIMRREGYVLDVKLPVTSGGTTPSLAWRLAAKKPGKHEIELGYRADGLAWSADYSAILDETGASMDFRAWATIKNQTGGAFDDAQVTLVSGAMTLSGTAIPGLPAATPSRFALPAAIRLGVGDSVQVELTPAKIGVKPRSVVAYESMPDPSADYQTYPNTDCSQYNGQGGEPTKSEVALEIDLPAGASLPPGHVRLFKRRAGGHVDVVSEDELTAQNGVARIRIAADTDITAERVQDPNACTVDEAKRIMREKIDLKFENKAKKAIEVVAREYMWRSTMWKVENDKNRPASGQTHEFRVTVPAGGKATVSYTAVYTWN